MDKASINIARISAVLAVSSVCIVAERINFRKIEDSSSTDTCSDFVGRTGNASSAVVCGLDCTRNDRCRGFLYDPLTTACKDVHKYNMVDPECRADDGADYYLEVCDRFLVSGPYGVPNSQLSESSYWCDDGGVGSRYCRVRQPRPLSAYYARLNTRGLVTGAWAAKYGNKYQYVQVDFLKPKIVTKYAMQPRWTSTAVLRQHVTSFKFLYSDDCSTFEELTDDNGNPLILEGNKNVYQTVVRPLPRRVTARCFRINPVTWVSGVTLRFDLIGCP